MVYYIKGKSEIEGVYGKKRNLVISIFILIVVVITIKNKNSFVNTTAKQVVEESQDILYQDVIITALSPTIIIALEDYYKNFLSYIPLYDSSTIKILNIERPNGYRTSHFIINIEVKPFIGPHIQVGKDTILIDLSYPGNPKILKFEHVENYPLPERYKDLYLH